MSLASVYARRLLARRRRVLGWNLQILIDRPGTPKWTVLSVTRKSDQVLPFFMNCFLKLVREKVLLDGDHSRVAIRFIPKAVSQSNHAGFPLVPRSARAVSGHVSDCRHYQSGLARGLPPSQTRLSGNSVSCAAS